MSAEKLKTAVTAIGGVIMYFTPEPIDAVITGLLSLFGVTALFASKNEVSKDRRNEDNEI